ncbi:MAG: 4-(cytidine 5'-diphospho)-2-C-methyl-D-erythritol kinase [Alphaproteobacteria bacterium]|nr:4-(cytidine 5'-diphospho)-2-C-methyl-D-erythritol kinase [Alphaproteobacteria bacterium]
MSGSAGGAVAAFAPAKINLYLHVLGRRDDGYHLLDSLVAFADIGDEVLAAPAAGLSLAVSGPEAGALAALGEDNLVLRAARRLAAQFGVPPRAALRLDKRLPAASGIGGGSSDAAAALRALGMLWGLALDGAALAVAAALGADVPVCLAGRPAWVGGIGDSLTPLPDLPPLGVVLANPRRELPTPAVFRARQGSFAPAPVARVAIAGQQSLLALLRGTRNDLTPAAVALMPQIGPLLSRLAALPHAYLARMSGSGATCFALFPDRLAAARAAGRLAAEEPGWWCAAGELLSGPPPLMPAGRGATGRAPPGQAPP